MEDDRFPWRVSWRWIAGAVLFGAGLLGFVSGVGVSERPELVQASIVTKAYYTLGLFVVGGLDLGTPIGGPWLGRMALWFAYFGAPLFTASAVMEAVLRVLARRRWQLRRLRDHVIVAGNGPLTRGYLRALRSRDSKVRVIIVVPEAAELAVQELEQTFDSTVLVGDITQEFLLRRLRLKACRRVLLFGPDDFESFEAASRILALRPSVASRLILHCHNLRYLRSMQETEMVRRFESFNVYNLSGQALVRDLLLDTFQRTQGPDTVVLAGFGRFGQTILEQLDEHARGELAQVAVVDADADRRMLVVEEQARVAGDYERLVLEGDIGHPQVWRQLERSVDLHRGTPVMILGTGNADQNLRTGMWLKRQYTNALIIVRTNARSEFAGEMAREYDMTCISIAQLVQQALPDAWFR